MTQLKCLLYYCYYNKRIVSPFLQSSGGSSRGVIKFATGFNISLGYDMYSCCCLFTINAYRNTYPLDIKSSILVYILLFNFTTNLFQNYRYHLLFYSPNSNIYMTYFRILLILWQILLKRNINKWSTYRVTRTYKHT